MKQQAVELYLSGQVSIEEVCKKYQLRSRSQLEQWIMVYNGQKGFRSPGGRRSAQLAMVSYEDRKAAIEYCIAHEKNYKPTAACFGFTYQQVYGWVHRYQALFFEAFEQAFQRYPDAHPLIRSDRGAQYTSYAFRKRMKEAGACQSMSRPGKCLDNAPMEGFWGTLKSEMYYPHHFNKYSQLCQAVSEYIYFYNHERYQRKLGCMTPMEFLAAEYK